MEYKIAICSHNRVKTLKKKTLALLDQYHIPKNKIFIFVAPEEIQTYIEDLRGYQVLPGALGLAENRNAVIDTFSEGDAVIFLDDDLRGFMEWCDHGRQPVKDLDKVFRQGFEEASAAKASLWGFYPVANASWLKPRVVTGLFFIYGCAYGLFIRKDTKSTTSFKEDYERSLRFYKRDGFVLRMEYVAPLQSFAQGSGGLNEERTLEKEEAGCIKIQEEFGALMSYKFDKGEWKIKLKRIVSFIKDVRADLL